MSEARSQAVYDYLQHLQANLCATFSGADFGGEFLRDVWQREGSEQTLSGRGITAVQEHGTVFERAGVALSDVRGNKLPPAATARPRRRGSRPSSFWPPTAWKIRGIRSCDMPARSIPSCCMVCMTP